MFCLLVLALVPPETLDMEDKSEAPTAVTIGSEDFATVYRSCFSDTMNNNMSVTSVNIGDKVLTIMGDTVDLVMEAGAALEKYFNVVLEESEIEEAEGKAVEAVLPALPGEDVVVGEMETDSGQALDCTGPEVLETEDQDFPGAALNTAAATGAEESSVQEPRSSRGEESRGGP